MAARNGSRGGERAARRVVLLGGKALGVRCLEAMLGMPEIDVVAVVPCADDDPNAQRWYPSLARCGRERGVQVYQPASVSDAGFLPLLMQLSPDLLLSVFYDKILKRRVLEVPALAAVNIHFGLLPYNRGSFPVPWAIIDGNDPGVTIHYMDPGVDTGDIIAQMAVPAADHETARDVYRRCTEAGLYLFERFVPPLLQGCAPRRPQPAGGSYYRPGYPFDRWVDWSQSAAFVSRFVRALTFPPFPAARTAFRHRELEICHPSWPWDDSRRWPAGSVVDISDRWVTVTTGDGLLTVRSIRLDGEELPAPEALRRLRCSEGDVFESIPWVKSNSR